MGQEKTQTKLQLRERPILFSRRMVRAILNLRKTQTRRLVKTEACPYQKGDILYVRETWWQRPNGFPDRFPKLYYDASVVPWQHLPLKAAGWKKKPAIHLPKKDSRIKLRIEKVWQERLQDISAKDALAEGVDYGFYPLIAFSNLWNSIHKKPPRRWEDNPLVWVIKFELYEVKTWR